MTRVSLVEAFRIGVLNDLAFVAAIDEASKLISEEGTPSYAWRMRTGAYPGKSVTWANWWPIAPNEHELGFAWFPFGKPSRSPPDRQLADAAIEDRRRLALDVIAVLDAFLTPLREGRTKLVGVPAAATIQPDVLPAVWRDPATCFDPVAGSIGRVVGGVDGAADHETILIQWTAVELVAAESVPAARGKLPPTRNLDKERIPWNAALDQVLFKMSNGKRYSRAELKSDMLSSIQKNYGAIEETQVMRFFRTYYPEFWALLRDD